MEERTGNQLVQIQPIHLRVETLHLNLQQQPPVFWNFRKLQAAETRKRERVEARNRGARVPKLQNQIQRALRHLIVRKVVIQLLLHHRQRTMGNLKQRQRAMGNLTQE